MPSSPTLKMNLNQRRRFWEPLIDEGLQKIPTPFYVFSSHPIEQALADLKAVETNLGIPARHWLSFKTQPLRPLLGWWRHRGGGVEVVSEFEFRAALAEGFVAEQILVNGPAKHRWLHRHEVRNLRVNFDSAAEVRELLPMALKLDWRLGIRFFTSEEFDPEAPDWPTQFGFAPDEAIDILKSLQRAGARVETAHFHLRTNVASPEIYHRAIQEIAETCRKAGFTPKFLDCGGGLPPPDVRSRSGKAYDAEFNLEKFGKMLGLAVSEFPYLEELWLENGRFISARSGVLVVRVLDVKERRGLRQLVCDGGRTMNALISTWEAHELFVMPRRAGKQCLTTVYGPTCMAFDQLTRRSLPRSIEPGDHLVWMDAGAYHLPWETRFSHGLAAVLWHDGNHISIAREAEQFDQWWGQWK
ncbi:MAG: hypothetical protein EXS31_06935 [Pedosphaera sp.]|nr:hypothetical protein [Pedosphaera sp.]